MYIHMYIYILIYICIYIYRDYSSPVGLRLLYRKLSLSGFFYVGS